MGKSTAEMKTISTFVNAGWDITGTIWRIDQTSIINNGYPFLAWQNTGGTPLPVEPTKSKVAPSVFILGQNYPNPFNPTTKISFSVSKTEQAKLVVYNLLGQQIKTLFDGVAESRKSYEMNFNASGLASGVYFYKLTTPTQTDIKRMQVMK